MEPTTKQGAAPRGPDLAKLAGDLEQAAADGLILLRGTIRRMADKVKSGDLKSRDALTLAKTVQAADELARRIRWQETARKEASE